MSTNLCTVLSVRDATRGVLVLDAVQTAPSSCVLAPNIPDSTSTPRTFVDTALASCRPRIVDVTAWPGVMAETLLVVPIVAVS